MISMMRTKAATWVARILAVLLILAFAVWGIEDMFRIPSGTETVARVDDTPISRQDFSAQFGRLMNAMRGRLGPEFDARQAVQLGLAEQTLEQMINARLITLEAREMGLTAGEALIRQTILADPSFQGLGGRFDRDRFQSFLRQEGMPESVYVATLRDQILREQITGTLASSTSVPRLLQDTIYQYRNERRVANVVVVPLGKPADVAAPTDAQLAEFHRNNPGLFTAPEYRRVTAIHLDPDEFARTQNPSEERVRQEFEHRKPTLSVPERRTVEQVLLLDEAKAKAKALSQALQKGRPFGEAVKEATGREPTVLRRVSRADIPDGSVAAAAFSLEKGAVSEPVKSALGWHILHVTAIDPGKTARFEEHRDKIRNELAREMAVDDIISLTGKLDDTLATGAPLEEAAAAIGARARTIEAISAEGLDPSGKPVSGIPKDPVFLERVFSAAAGEPTNVEETRGGGFFVLRVDKVIPPAVRPLAEVRARATDEWKQRKLHSTARAKAETLQKAAKAAGSLARAAKTGEHKLMTSEPFSRFRREPDSPVSAELSAALFSAKPGEVVVAEAPGGYGVASVSKVLPAEPGKNTDEMQNLRAELKSALATDTVSQYIAALRKQYPVTINRAALDAATGVDSGG